MNDSHWPLANVVWVHYDGTVERDISAGPKKKYIRLSVARHIFTAYENKLLACINFYRSEIAGADEFYLSNGVPYAVRDVLQKCLKDLVDIANYMDSLSRVFE